MKREVAVHDTGNFRGVCPNKRAAEVKTRPEQFDSVTFVTESVLQMLMFGGFRFSRGTQGTRGTVFNEFAPICKIREVTETYIYIIYIMRSADPILKGGKKHGSKGKDQSKTHEL